MSHTGSNAALARTLKEWQQAGVFDAFSLLDFPPTFVGEKNFTKEANALIEEVGGPFIIVTLPVGTAGWESWPADVALREVTSFAARAHALTGLSEVQLTRKRQYINRLN